jgi:hypothetical protein
MWECVLLSVMKVKGAKKSSVRNGKVYVGAWLDKTIVDSAKKTASRQKRTLAAYLELAVSYHNQCHAE